MPKSSCIWMFLLEISYTRDSLVCKQENHRLLSISFLLLIFFCWRLAHILDWAYFVLMLCMWGNKKVYQDIIHPKPVYLLNNWVSSLGLTSVAFENKVNFSGLVNNKKNAMFIMKDFRGLWNINSFLWTEYIFQFLKMLL